MADPKCLPYLLLCYKTLTHNSTDCLAFIAPLSLFSTLLCPWPRRPEPVTILKPSPGGKRHAAINCPQEHFLFLFPHSCCVIVNTYDFHAGLTLISTTCTHSTPPPLCGHLMTRLHTHTHIGFKTSVWPHHSAWQWAGSIEVHIRIP